ncbi:death-associated protein-like 1 homolog [Latimeria chalumnae]|uniref:death-associated protein-like 1 homolog n=1 Tax=Latimeria chalumnae TaxID=7897 RepID=UPI00313B297D
MAQEVKQQSGSLKAGHLPAVKAGRMRVSKKQGNEENAPAERDLKKPTTEKTSSVRALSKMQTMNILLAGTLEKLSHKLPMAAAQVAHQKPRPNLEKIVVPKRMYIIQQPRKC